MAQKTFGRRQPAPSAGGDMPATDSASRLSPDLSAALALADTPSRSATKSLLILAAVAGCVAVLAIGVAHAVGSAWTGESSNAQQECFGQRDCSNQYRVSLECGDDQAKSVDVIAADAEAAERKAERYNRDCRARRSAFVASLIRSAAVNTHHGRASEASQATSNVRRRAWRVRLR
jgi:hypothetical protein